MYSLPYFQEKDEKVIRAFIDRHPFAFITGCDASHKPVATQIPVFIEEHDGKKILRGHMMKNTDHHKAFVQNPHVLVVFTGAHTYVSATWYSDPHQASTWNYMSVHASGSIRFLDDQELIEALRKVSMHFEGYDPGSTTVFDNLSPSYTEPLMKAIVAFEIEVKEIRNVFKLSQNRDKASYLNIIDKLRQGDHDAGVIADEMEKRLKELYG
jgi:transcriptional regulator